MLAQWDPGLIRHYPVPRDSTVGKQDMVAAFSERPIGIVKLQMLAKVSDVRDFLRACVERAITRKM